jgi:hypothetical protein
MDDKPAVGWHRDPDGPDQFHYWNGREWSGHATVSEMGTGMRSIMLGGSLGHYRSSWYRKGLQNSLVFHILAWFDCSVPLTRGRLRRFMQPREMQTLDQSGRFVTLSDESIRTSPMTERSSAMASKLPRSRGNYF